MPMDGDSPAFQRWVLRRRLEKDVILGPNGEAKIDARGFLVGRPCSPPANSLCSNPDCRVSMEQAEHVPTKESFVLRTVSGAVKRPIVDFKCRTCGHTTAWDPAAEFIHTVKKGREGGGNYYFS